MLVGDQRVGALTLNGRAARTTLKPEYAEALQRAPLPLKLDVPLPRHLEVAHHARLVVLEDVAVIHPVSGTIVRFPGDAGRAPRR